MDELANMWNSIDENLVDRLKLAASEAQDTVVLVAPFMTRHAFKVVFSCLRPSVKLIVVTRWNYLDIVAGVSDPNIWLDVKDRPNSTMYLSQPLHAKYFRFDESTMVGSTNLTRPGIQVARPYNIEILAEIEVPISARKFENDLLASAVEVDETLYHDALKILSEQHKNIDNVEEEHGSDSDLYPVWIPFLRNPSSLWLAYSQQFDLMTHSEREHAAVDLTMWSIPLNLEKDMFENVVRSELLHTPMMSKIDKVLETPQRFGAIRDLIRRQYAIQEYERDSSEAWQSGMRWLLYFFPDRYIRSVPRHSEVMVRRKSTQS